MGKSSQGRLYLFKRWLRVQGKELRIFEFHFSSLFSARLVMHWLLVCFIVDQGVFLDELVIMQLDRRVEIWALLNNLKLINDSLSR